jgi:hypothetical protein
LVDQDEYPAAQQIHERCIVGPRFPSMPLPLTYSVHDLKPLARTKRQQTHGHRYYRIV